MAVMAAKTNAPEINPAHRGLLHKALGVAPGAKIPAKLLDVHKNSPDPHMQKMIQYALNAKTWNK